MPNILPYCILYFLLYTVQDTVLHIIMCVCRQGDPAEAPSPCHLHPDPGRAGPPSAGPLRGGKGTRQGPRPCRQPQGHHMLRGAVQGTFEKDARVPTHLL